MNNHMKDSKATPKKGSSTHNSVNGDTPSRNEIGNSPEIGQPDPSIATPVIPSEMPSREIK